MKILGLSNAKTVKGEKLGWLTGICYLAPYTMAGHGNVCKDSTPECRALCLFTAGRGKMPNVWQSRIAKTNLFFEDNNAFMVALDKDLEAMLRKADREGLKPCVRLNGTSDIPWERLYHVRQSQDQGYANVMEAYPEIQFYDYTKRFDRMVKYCAGDMPDNYHLTFSLTEDNDAEALTVIRHGANVAYIHGGKPGSVVPNAPTIDGDEHDLRFLDESGCLVRLTPKGEAKKNADQYRMVR